VSRIVDRFVQLVFVALFAAIIVVAAVLSWPKYRQARALAYEREQVRLRIEGKKREIAQVREKQRRFQSDREFVESLARDNHRVFPGELVFVFEN